MFNHYQRVAQICGGMTGAISGIALIGWILSLPFLTQINPTYIPMAPNTALSFFILGALLFILETPSQKLRRTGQTLALLALSISVFRLGEFTFQVDLSVDRWVFRFATGTLGEIPTGKMAFFTALAFSSAAIAAFLFLQRPSNRSRETTSGVLAMGTAGVGLIFLLGYLYGAPLLYGGETIPMAFNTALAFLFLGGGLAITSAGRENRSQLRSEHQLIESEKKFRSLVSNIPCAVYQRAYANNWAMNYLSDAIEDISGYPAEDFINKRIRSFASLIHPEDESLVERVISDHVLQKSPYRIEYRIQHADGGFRWVLEHGRAEFGEQGEVLWLDGAIFDITEGKRIGEEIQSLNRNLLGKTVELESANMELEAFSYSVSHDLRAPLRSIDGFSQIMEEDHASQLDKEGLDHLGRIRAATNRMGRLIDALLSLSRVTRSELNFQEVDLGKIADSHLREFQSSEPDRPVSWNIHENMIVEGDEHLLRILLQNLISNAWKFTVRTPQANITVGSQVSPNGERIFFVNDNGAGFDDRYTSKLFEPFQRLHKSDEFEGTGIGLATVLRIVTRHGGRAWAESKLGEGATFYFTLPEPEKTDPLYARTAVSELGTSIGPPKIRLSE